MATELSVQDIADSVIYSKTAKDLYTDLEQRFGQSNRAKKFHLQKELSGLVQANTDVAGYYTKMKRLWDELDSLNSDNKCNCNCVCGGKQKLTKSLEDERLIMFLMGLNEAYAPARSNILMIKPSLTLIMHIPFFCRMKIKGKPMLMEML